MLLRKIDVLKSCLKSKFLGKKLWRNAPALKSKKVQGIFGETFILGLFSLLVFGLQNRASDVRVIKGFYQSSLGKYVDFRDIMNVLPYILAKNFVDERALMTATLISSFHWKILGFFCFWKKRPEHAFLILTVNYRKIVQKTNYAIQNINKLAI